MNPVKRLSARGIRGAVALALVLTLVGAGTLAWHGLEVESAQAQSLVTAGQSALRAGDRARAALAFERAELLAPRAAFVKNAVSAANLKSAASPAIRVLAWVTPREWSTLVVAFGWVAGLGLALALGVANTRFARRLAYVSGLLFLACVAGAAQATLTARALSVINTATGVLVAPYPGAGASADLAPGVVVAVGARYADFVRIDGPDGAHGWIEARALDPLLGG